MVQHTSKYDSTIHEMLDRADWEDVLPRVLKYAISRAKKFQWLGDKVEPEALVQEAIARAYGVGLRGSYRNWNKEKCPDLANFLIGIVRSMTSHKAEHETEFPNESLFDEDGSLKNVKIFHSVHETGGPSKYKSPEEEIIEKENLQILKNELDLLSSADENLGMVILCIEDGVSRPRQIAEETGLEKEHVNNLLKRLRRKLDKYKPKMKRQSSKERWEEWE